MAYSVSSIQPNDYVLYIRICTFTNETEYSALCYTVGPCLFYIRSVYPLIPRSQFICSPISLLVTISYFSISVSLFLFFK